MGKISFKSNGKIDIHVLIDISAFLFILGLFVFENATYSTIFDIIQNLFIGIMFLYALKRRKIPVSYIYMWMGIFVITSFLITLLNINTGENSAVAIIIKNIVRGICLAIYITANDNYIKIVKFIAASGLICSVFIFTEFVSMGMNYSDVRYASFDRVGASIAGGNVNIVALNMSFAFTAWFFLLIKSDKRKNKLLCLACMIIITGMSLLTGTRKLLLFYAVVYFIYMFFYGSKKIRKIGMTFLVIIVCYYCILNIEPLYYLIGHKVDFFSDSNTVNLYEASDRIRENLLIGGINLFKENPIFGIGFGNTTQVIGNYAHNNFVELLASGGIVGFVAYYSGYIYIVLKSIHYRKSDKFALYIFASIMGLLVLEYFQVTYLYGMPWVLLVISMTYCDTMICNKDK